MKVAKMNIDIFDFIDEWGVTAKSIRQQLNQLTDGEELTVYINSPGGNVFEGLAIFNLLTEYNPTVKIIGEASSIASVIAMAAGKGKLLMAETSMMFLHKPWSMLIGDEDDADKFKEDLKDVKTSMMKAYQKRAGMSDDEIDNLLAEAKYHSAEKCVELGLADGIYEPSENENSKAANTRPFLGAKFAALQQKYSQENKPFFNNKEEAMDIESLKSQVSDLKAQLSLKGDVISSLKDEKKDLNAKIESMTTENNQLKKTKSELEDSVKALNSKVDGFAQKELEMKVDNFMAQNHSKITPAEKDELRAELLIALKDEGDEARKINGKSPWDRLTDSIKNSKSYGKHGFDTNAEAMTEDDEWDDAFAEIDKEKNV